MSVSVRVYRRVFGSGCLLASGALAAARGVTRDSRVIDLLLISTRTTRPADKQGAKACARAVLPHSNPLGGLRLVRSLRFIGSFRSVTHSSPSRYHDTARVLPAQWTSKPTTHKPSKWSLIGYNVLFTKPIFNYRSNIYNFVIFS